LNAGSIPKVAPTGVESLNRIKDIAGHFYLSRHTSRQFELDHIGRFESCSHTFVASVSDLLVFTDIGGEETGLRSSNWPGE
jgi:hypothetical protein